MTQTPSKFNGVSTSPKISTTRPLGPSRGPSNSRGNQYGSKESIEAEGGDEPGSLLLPAMTGSTSGVGRGIGGTSPRSRSPALPLAPLPLSSSSAAGPSPSYSPNTSDPISPRNQKSRPFLSTSTSSSTIPPRLAISRNPSSSIHANPYNQDDSPSSPSTNQRLNPYSSSNPDPNNPYSPSSSSPQHSGNPSSSSSYFPPPPNAAREQHPLSAPREVAAGSGLMLGGKPFFDSEAFWLGLYFFFNLGLTLFNKIVLVSFPFPYTLTGLHALSGCIGCYFALERGSFTPAHLTSRDNLVLAAFSVLYTINIAVSNLSLQLVTIPFHQVVRAATPLFTIMISVLVLRASFSRMKILSLLPVVAGVGFATYGDYYFTTWGLILTLIGTALAALKTVTTNLIQTGAGGRLKLHPLDLLMRMSPLAFIQCVAYGWWTGELEKVRRFGAREMDGRKAMALVINGVIAFGLNVVSFTANKKTSALTMTVSANVKQVLTIILAVIIFDLTISPINCLGIVLTLAGGAGYAYIEYKEGRKKTVRKGSQ